MVENKLTWCLLGLFWAGVYQLFLTQHNYKLTRMVIGKTSKKAQGLRDRIEVPIKQYVRKRENAQIDREVYEAISLMRNIIAIDRGKLVSTDFIVEQLAKKEGILQNTYIKMLSLLRVNRRKEAQNLLGQRLRTDIGKEFAGLLIRWDDINPEELTEILFSHQKSIKEIRVTEQKKFDETVSDILYFPIIVNVILIFINFIYVGYFLSQKEMLQMLF